MRFVNTKENLTGGECKQKVFKYLFQVQYYFVKTRKIGTKVGFSKVLRCNVTTQREGFKLIKEDARLKREVTTKGANSGGK